MQSLGPEELFPFPATVPTVEPMGIRVRRIQSIIFFRKPGSEARHSGRDGLGRCAEGEHSAGWQTTEGETLRRIVAVPRT